MNANTGQLYEIRDEVLSPHNVDFGALRDLEQKITDSERQALADHEAGDPIVPVSEVVAQKLRLGERELARRKNRRRPRGVVGH